jgi:hypothetical protein
MNLNDFLKGALSAALAAAVAFVTLNYVNLDLDPLLKQIIAFLAVALWNRFRPFARG